MCSARGFSPPLRHYRAHPHESGCPRNHLEHGRLSREPHDVTAQRAGSAMGLGQAETAQHANALAQELPQPLPPAPLRLGLRHAAHILLGEHGAHDVDDEHERDHAERIEHVHDSRLHPRCGGVQAACPVSSSASPLAASHHRLSFCRRGGSHISKSTRHLVKCACKTGATRYKAPVPWYQMTVPSRRRTAM